MSIVSGIAETVRRLGYKVDGVIQHAYNPLANDAIQFFVYSGNRITHIVSSIRNPMESCRRLHKQNEVMEHVFQQIRDSVLKDSILFSTQVVNLRPGCFRIQEFKQRAFSFQETLSNALYLGKYMDVSCSWILAFQEATTCHQAVVSASDIRETTRHYAKQIREIYGSEPHMDVLLETFKAKINSLHHSMPVSAHHGDYCFWNCFLDTSGTFRVIDWEFAKTSEWVVFDVLSNLLAIWIRLRKLGIAKGLFETFFVSDNDRENLFHRELARMKDWYGFDENESKVYLVYAFLRLFLRDERPVTRNHWDSHVPDMMSLLQSVKD